MKANEPESRQPQEAAHPNLRITESDLESTYVNLTRVTAGPEEVLIDFGMTAPVPQNPQQQVGKIACRVVMNYYNAKRLAMTLNATVARYEKAFGQVELDPRKRQLPGGDD